MGRLISGIPFCDCDSYPCDYVALDVMLQFFGYTTATVLHDEWYFSYQLEGSAEVKISPRITHFQTRLRQCGIHVTVHHERDGETAWKCAKSRIDEGVPVPAVADTYYLERYYYPGLGHHSSHAVILAGYDDEMDMVHIVDPSPTKLFRGSLPISGLKEAWGSDEIPKFTWLEIKCSEPRWNLTSDETERSINKNIQFMRGDSFHVPGTCLGLTGLRSLANDLEHWKWLKKEKARKLLDQVFRQTQMVIPEREGHAKFLEFGAVSLRDRRLCQLARQFKTISQKWLVFRNLCYIAQKRALIPTLEKLYKRLLEIANLEEAALNDLELICNHYEPSE